MTVLLRWTPAVAFLEVDDEIVLWHETVLHRLNPMAAALWTALATPSTAAQLESAAAAAWHQSAKQAAPAVRALLEQLVSAGLIEAVE